MLASVPGNGCAGGLAHAEGSTREASEGDDARLVGKIPPTPPLFQAALNNRLRPGEVNLLHTDFS